MFEGRGETIIGRKNQQSANHESLHIPSSLSLNLSLKTIHQSNDKQRANLSWCTTWTGCLSNIFQAPAILQQTGPHKKQQMQETRLQEKKTTTTALSFCVLRNDDDDDDGDEDDNEDDDHDGRGDDDDYFYDDDND